MRELRRSVEIVVGELLALMRDRGLRRGGGGDQASENRSRPPSLADYGLGWATAKRWETRPLGSGAELESLQGRTKTQASVSRQSGAKHSV